jgi:nitroreductase
MLEAVRNRRSIRRYRDRPIDAATLKDLQKAALHAPTSRNLRPCSFVFVTDGRLLRELAHAKPSFAEWIGGAPLGIVICADASVSDCWVEDGSIAAATIQLVATDLGLGSCWIQIRARQHRDGRPAEEYVREVLDLPDELSVLCMLSIGYPAEKKPPRTTESLPWEKIEVRGGNEVRIG